MEEFFRSIMLIKMVITLFAIVLAGSFGPANKDPGQWPSCGSRQMSGRSSNMFLIFIALLARVLDRGPPHHQPAPFRALGRFVSDFRGPSAVSPFDTPSSKSVLVIMEK